MVDYVLIVLFLGGLSIIAMAKYKEIMSFIWPNQWMRNIIEKADGSRMSILTKKPKPNGKFLIWNYRKIIYWCDPFTPKLWGRVQSWVFHEGKITAEDLAKYKPDEIEKLEKEALEKGKGLDLRKILPSENSQLIDDYCKQENYKMFDRPQRLPDGWWIWLLIGVGILIALNYMGVIHIFGGAATAAKP